MDIQNGLIPIQDFNQGGLAFSKWSGLTNSLYKMIGFNPHSQPGVLLVEQKFTKDSGIVVTEFCREAINCSNNIRYWFSYTSGKIWQEKAGTYTLVYTVVPGAGAAGCSGAAEYEGYLYWATQSRLHRIPIDSDKADGSAAWTANAVPNWATFTKTDASFHPMYVHPAQQILYIGDASYLAQVDAGTFTANALDIATPLRIKSLGQFDTDLLIGTYIADTVTQSVLFRWNCWSVSFTNSDVVPENGINCFLPADNMILIQAGDQGNIYFYDGIKLELYMKIPGTYSSTAYGEVHPSSAINKGGQVLFGFSNGLGNPADQLIYRLARNNREFPFILDAPYPISERNGSDFVLNNVEIGGILVAGSDIYSSWKRKATTTMTIADPAVVTYTAHGITDGSAIVFTTTGALPTGVTSGTIYFARSVTVDTLHLYDTSAHAVSGGATGRVVTSGTQSGVHTAMTVGIDQLDYSNKLDGAYFETRVQIVKREEKANFAEAMIAYNSKPASTDINFYIDINYAGYGSALTKVDDTQRCIVKTKDEGIEFNTLQLKVKITTSSDNAPSIESGAIVVR